MFRPRRGRRFRSVCRRKLRGRALLRRCAAERVRRARRDPRPGDPDGRRARDRLRRAVHVPPHDHRRAAQRPCSVHAAIALPMTTPTFFRHALPDDSAVTTSAASPVDVEALIGESGDYGITVPPGAWEVDVTAAIQAASCTSPTVEITASSSTTRSRTATTPPQARSSGRRARRTGSRPWTSTTAGGSPGPWRSRRMERTCTSPTVTRTACSRSTSTEGSLRVLSSTPTAASSPLGPLASRSSGRPSSRRGRTSPTRTTIACSSWFRRSASHHRVQRDRRQPALLDQRRTVPPLLRDEQEPHGRRPLRLPSLGREPIPEVTLRRACR